MPKTNYQKVEGAFDEGLRKLLIDKLLESTEKKPKQHEAEEETPGITFEVESSEAQRQKEVRIQTLLTILRDLKFVYKLDSQVYKNMKISPKKMRRYVENPAALSPQEWEEIKKIKHDVEVYHRDLLDKLPLKSNEEIIDEQRKAHTTKRHKVNPNWLPLHRLNP